MQPLELRPVIYRTVALVIAVAMAPWLTGGRDMTAVTISAFVLLLGSLLIWRQAGVPAAGDRWLGAAYGLFLTWSAASCIWSVNRYQSVVWCLYLAMAGLVFVLAARLRQVPAFRAWLLGAYLWTAGAAAAYGLWLYLTESYPRLTTSFYWPNPAAAYFIPAVVYSLERAAASWRYRLAALAFMSALWLTDSRGGLLALALAIIIFVAWQRPKRGYWINSLFIIIIAFGLSTGISQLRSQVLHQGQATVPGSRFAEAATGESNSVKDRLYYLESSLQIWSHHPVIGTGADTFGAVHPQYQKRVVSASTNPHNLFVQMLPELGVVGLLLLVVMLSRLLYGTVAGSQGEAQLVALCAGLIGLLAHFGVDMDDRYPALILLLAALGGLTYRPAAVLARRLWRPALLAAVVGALAISGFESQVWSTRAQAAQDDGHYQEAADDFAQAHSYLLYDPDVLTGEGINQYTLAVENHDRQANLALALQQARLAIGQDPHDAQHYFLAAKVERFNHNWGAATADYRQAIRLDPYNHPEYYDDLARLELLEHQSAAAKATASTILQQYPPAVIANRQVDAALKPALGSVYLARAQAEHDLGQEQLARQDTARAIPLLVGQ